jgi:putative membrane protein
MRHHVAMRAHFLVRWAFNVAALWVAERLLTGVYVSGDEALTLILAGLIFSIVSMFVKPALAILTLPLIIATLGFAYFLVAVLMVVLTSALVENFHVSGFWAAAATAVIVWAVNTLLGATQQRSTEPRL